MVVLGQDTITLLFPAKPPLTFWRAVAWENKGRISPPPPSTRLFPFAPSSRVSPQPVTPPRSVLFRSFQAVRVSDPLTQRSQGPN